MRYLIAALFLLLATGWAAPVWAQSAELVEAFNRQKELREQGRYAEAIPFAKKALALGKKEFGPEHETTGALLDHLARLYYRQGRYAEAEPLYQRSLAIKEKALGPDHPSVATTLGNLAGLYDNQRRYAEAEPLYQRGLAIKEKALGPDHCIGLWL